MFGPDVPRKNLYASIAAMRDGLEVDAVSAIFDRLLLPEPRGGEYRSTSDWGYLVFLNDQGCTLRITSNVRCPPLEHHRILKPLIRFDLGQHRLDINPGIKLSSTGMSANRMTAILAKDRIYFWDNDARNCGAIPAECTNSFFDYTVVCDEGAYTATRQGPSGLHKIFNTLVVANDNEPDRQDRAYGALRQAFQQAVAARSDTLMGRVWALCRDKKAMGHLRADWADPPKNHPREIRDLGQNYSRQLSHLRS